MVCGSEPSTPGGLNEIRDRISFKRWRLYETVEGLLAEIESRIDWERLYDVDVELGDLLAWGLFLEETLKEVMSRVRGVAAEAEPPEARPEASPEELEDHLLWGTRQIEGGIRQSLSLLSREMVSLITAPARELPAEEAWEKKRSLAMPIAEVAGKLRSDLRKLTTFLVAEGLWDPDDVELVLFPEKRHELEKGRGLKERLVEAMQGFQGSDDRLPVAQVIRMWRNGQALGQAAMAEIDTLIHGLISMLDKGGRRGLYLDSYYRLGDWIRHLESCSRGLKEHLGDAAVEDALTKEIAAVLDAEILAEILGEESLRAMEVPWGLGELLTSVTRRELRKLELGCAEEERVLELRTAVRTALETRDPVDLAVEDEALLTVVAGRIRGQRMVERLRLRGDLPGDMAHLTHLQALVQVAEDGLKTYLMLLYGQIQNRDLHLLEEDQREVPMAEKRLAMAELEYRWARLDASQACTAFKAVRRHLVAGEAVSADEWHDLRRFIDQLSRVIAPRLQRLASFDEVGAPVDGAARIRAACEHLEAIDGPPGEDKAATVQGWTESLASLLLELRDVNLVMAPPQTEAEIEDFLNMLG